MNTDTNFSPSLSLSLSFSPSKRLSLLAAEMSSSEAGPSIPFRSKKPLKSKSKTLTLDTDPLSAKTPEKPPQLRRRTRNRNVALSLKEVRKAAESLREPDPKQPSPARRKIADCSEEDGAIAAAAAAAKSKRDAAAAPSKLPEIYETLCEFFNGLDNSIRLLRLKGSTPSFTNICPKIECFTDRRFTYRHLAQLKFILPEVIEIKKTLVFNERTSCMRPDLHITMNLDALASDGKLKSEGPSIYLKKLFRLRLVDFLKNHPEGQEVPVETLPGAFGVRKQDVHSDSIDDSALHSETSSEAPNGEPPTVATHLPPTFRRRFSQKPGSNRVENVPKESPALSSVPAATSVEEGSSDQVLESEKAIPSKVLSLHKIEECSPSKIADVLSTPAKLASTPARLMTVTPGLCPPKRSYMSPDGDCVSSPNKLVRRPPRSLKFDSPVKNNKVKDEVDLDSNGASVDNDILDILPENLLQSIREKERVAMEERDPAISQAKKRREMIACLPRIFNIIHFLFQSISRSVITKEELIHKIISSHSDIVDRREVKDQLSLLLELAPDWISEKLASGGDLLIRINKTSSPDSIRARLEEAKRA